MLEVEFCSGLSQSKCASRFEEALNGEHQAAEDDIMIAKHVAGVLVVGSAYDGRRTLTIESEVGGVPRVDLREADGEHGWQHSRHSERPRAWSLDG